MEMEKRRLIPGKRLVWIALLVIGGFLLVSLGGRILSGMAGEQELPEGWHLIRPPGETYAMIEEGPYIWTGGQPGVFRLDRKEFRLIEQLVLPKEVDYVKALHVDQQGTLWIGHFNGITLKEGEEYRTLDESHGLPDLRINCIYEDDQGRILVGTWGGVAIYDGVSWQTLTQDQGLMENMVNVIMQDSLGGYWFGHYLAPRGGISYLREGNWQYFSVDQGLPHNNITSFYEDSTGRVWAGMGLFERGGAVSFIQQGAQWVIERTLSREDGLAGEKVRFIFQDREDKYWFTSEFDGIAVYTKENLQQGGESTVYNEEDGLANYEVKVVLQDADGVIWLGTHYGVNAITQKALEGIPKQR